MTTHTAANGSIIPFPQKHAFQVRDYRCGMTTQCVNALTIERIYMPDEEVNLTLVRNADQTLLIDSRPPIGNEADMERLYQDITDAEIEAEKDDLYLFMVETGMLDEEEEAYFLSEHCPLI